MPTRWVSDDEYKQLRAKSAAVGPQRQQQASTVYSAENPSANGKYQAGDIYQLPNGQKVQAAGDGRWVPVQ